MKPSINIYWEPLFSYYTAYFPLLRRTAPNYIVLQKYVRHDSVLLTQTIQTSLLLGDKGYLGELFKNEFLTMKGISVRSNIKDPLPKHWRSQLDKMQRRMVFNLCNW